MFRMHSQPKVDLLFALSMIECLLLAASTPISSRTLWLCHFDSGVGPDFANSGVTDPQEGTPSGTLAADGRFGAGLRVAEAAAPVWCAWDCFHPDRGTLEFWFKPAFDIRADRPGCLRTICQLGHRQKEDEYIGLRLMAKQLNEVWLGVSGYLEPVWDGIFIEPSRFYHVALTWQLTRDRKASEIALYVDGVRRLNIVKTLDVWPRQARLSLGAAVMGIPGFPGVYDEVRISDEVLYQEERVATPDTPFAIPTEKPAPILNIPPTTPARTFGWFNPAMVYVVGGNSPEENAFAPPYLLYANLINATLAQTLAFPGRRVGLSLYYMSDPRERPADDRAIRLGLAHAIRIAGGPDRVIFIPFLRMKHDDAIAWLRSIREKLGCHVGLMDFLYWKYRSVRSRSLARVTEALLLDPTLRDYQGDREDELFRKFEANEMVYAPCVSQQGGGPPSDRYLINGEGNRGDWDYIDPEVLAWWRECIILYARFFGKYRSFVGVALDEPCVSLQGAPWYSEGCQTAFKVRFGHEPPPFPHQEADRRGPEYLELMRFGLSMMTDYNQFCRRVLHDACPGAKYFSAQPSVRWPQGGCDHTERFMDILCCDAYSFFHHQLVYILMDSQLNDDCLDKVNPAHVTIVHPRRASWKYWTRPNHLWLSGEPASFNKSFRRWTPLVENVTDDVLFDHLDTLRGVLVWPMARVTSAQEDQRLVEWVRRGHVLLLSGTVAFDSLLDDKSDDAVLATAGLAPGPGEFPPGAFSLAEGTLIATGRTLPVGSLKVLNPRARIFARVENQPVSGLAPVGKGWVAIAFGRSSGMDYPTNVEIDPYLCALAKEVLGLAGGALSALSAPSGRLQFLATDGRFLNVFLPGGGKVALSRCARAYDPSARSKELVRFTSLGGASVQHSKDRAVATLSQAAGSATLRIIQPNEVHRRNLE